MSYNISTEKYEGYIYKIYNDCNDKLYIGQTITTLQERWHGHMSAKSNPKYKSVLYKAMRKYGKDNFHIEELLKIEADTVESLVRRLNKLEQEYILRYHSSIYENGYNVEWGGDNKTVKGRSVCKYDLNLCLLETYDSVQEAGRKNEIDGATIYNCCCHDYYTANGYIWAFEDQLPLLPLYHMGQQKPYDFIEGKDLHVNDHIINEAPNDIVRQNRLLKAGWNGKKVYMYNSYGEIVKIYNTTVDVIDDTTLDYKKLFNILSGLSCIYNKHYTFRYEDDEYLKFPISNAMQAITIYDLQGNIIKHFPTIHDAELFLKVPSGEVTKVLKRQGSCKGYLLSKYGEPLQRTLDNNRHIYLKCNSSWEVIKEYNNYQQIQEDMNISRWVISHKLKLAITNKAEFMGYYWKYKDEYFSS